MNPFWWLLALSILSFGEFSNGASRPAVVNIGAISMEAAVNDVNSDPSFLGGSKLNITVHDSNFNGFLSIIGGSFQGVPVNFGICGLYIVCYNVQGVPRCLTSEEWLSNFVDESLSPLHLLSASSLMYKREKLSVV